MSETPKKKRRPVVRKKTTTISFSLSPRLRDQIEQAAATEKRTVSNYLACLLEQELGPTATDEPDPES